MRDVFKQAINEALYWQISLTNVDINNLFKYIECLFLVEMTMKPVSTNKHCLPFYDRPNGCRKIEENASIRRKWIMGFSL